MTQRQLLTTMGQQFKDWADVYLTRDEFEAVISQYTNHMVGNEKLKEYKDEIFHFLDVLKIDKTYTVERIAKTENIELFTAIVKLYICKQSTTVSFLRDDFKQFRKNILVFVNFVS